MTSHLHARRALAPAGHRPPFLPAPAPAGAGQPVQILFVTHRRRRLFVPGEALTERTFDLVRRHEGTAAACLLPDRLHWLLADDQALSQEISCFKVLSTRAAWEAGARGEIWRRSFIAAPLPGNADIVDAARAIVGSPVRYGLVERIEDWPYQIWRL